jgi:lysozyme family protein
MPTVKFTSILSYEYQRLFDTCQIRPEKAGEVESLLSEIDKNRNRYESVGGALSIPWYVIAVIHSMEASLSFNTHLHNGDPLTARTVNEPARRPREGTPPYTWEESAIDALRYDKLDQCKDWSLPSVLYELEGYNGWGYRLLHPHVLSPYLWSGSNHYKHGKYVKDGRWSDAAVSAQLGAAVLLRRMAEKGMVDFHQPLPAAASSAALLRFAPYEQSPYVRELQAFLSKLPGIFVREDGVAGEKTSDAFRIATGYYLQGDPRAEA